MTQVLEWIQNELPFMAHMAPNHYLFIINIFLWRNSFSKCKKPSESSLASTDGLGYYTFITHVRNSSVLDNWSRLNPFFFARPGSTLHHRSSDCLRTFAQKCGAKNPDALKSTKLRKHIAILSTVLNMTETDQLANFLGHDLVVHREYYRLPEGTL